MAENRTQAEDGRDREPVVDAETLERRPYLCVSGICCPVGEGNALSDVTLQFDKGGLHGILGPRGAGKSELAEIIAGSRTSEKGSVSVGGVALHVGELAVKKKIGYLPEESFFPSDMTVGEVMEFVGEAKGVPAEKRYRQIKEAIDLLGLDALRRRLVGRLSASEERRLGLAASLLGNPELLVLDEPLLAGMSERRDETYELLRMLGRIKTVVLLSEDYDMIRGLCEDVAILSDGKVLAAGTFEALEDRLAHAEGKVTLAELYRQLLAASLESTGRHTMDKKAEESEKDAEDGEGRV